MTAADHIRVIYKYSWGPIFDSAIVNLAPVSPSLRESYREKGAQQVHVDAEAIQALGVVPSARFSKSIPALLATQLRWPTREWAIFVSVQAA